MNAPRETAIVPNDGRGDSIVWPGEEWRGRYKVMLLRRLGRYATYLGIIFVVLYSLNLWWVSGYIDNGATLTFWRVIFPFCSVVWAMIIIDVCCISYIWTMAAPTPGLYENGIQVPRGDFVPWSAIRGIHRDRRYGLVRFHDMVVLHPHRQRPTAFGLTYFVWQVPFELLGMEGLQELSERVRASPSPRAPTQRAPELRVYGPMH
jgi:hypothetical protein